jgi:uncharacterized protein (DUF697 family)
MLTRFVISSILLSVLIGVLKIPFSTALIVTIIGQVIIARVIDVQFGMVNPVKTIDVDAKVETKPATK